MCQGLNSHYFHIIGDKLINPIVGVYIPILRIPIKGGMTIPNIATFDRGTYNRIFFLPTTQLANNFSSSNSWETSRFPWGTLDYTPGSSNIAGWNMDPK